MSQYSFILSIDTKLDSNCDVAFTVVFNMKDTF